MPDIVVPLEDELGDVLEKAIRGCKLSVDDVAREAGISRDKLGDAMDYRSELTCAELECLAKVVHLNEVGLCALAQGKYPLPDIPGLPFSLECLRMPHGVGVANAYLISVPGESSGLLFDTGPSFTALQSHWPKNLKKVEAVFLTHLEAEHAGGLCDVVDCFGVPSVYVPQGSQAPCGEALDDGDAMHCGDFEVTAYSTPGHCSSHYCYRVCLLNGSNGRREVLISGDLIFAGSAGGGYFCCQQQQKNLQRILAVCPEQAVIAPGHGPLSTVGHERRFNPFVN
ncbi:MAG: MBL fold metallo-hydrolase [Opitutaceae bacterium]|jgi:hydroxyacylglutathione hydrolase|nr:MBL fold metallo-hydrolase [Opitutaceae bacterium]|tara:strand:+ start:1464 stop:2312 length:849 start_codon:yes stop_codon:yes gene_type:complete